LKYLTVFPKLLGLVRELLELIRHAEDIVAGGQQGAAKRELVLQVLDHTVELAQQLGIAEAKGIDRGKLGAVAGTVIDSLVAVLNQLGVFKHSPKAP
jgi:hypothetical protein